MISEPLPEQLVLRSSLKLWLPLVAAGGVAGVYLVGSIPADMVTPVDGLRMRWILGVLLAVLLIVALVNAPAQRLELDLQGFSELSLLYQYRHQWCDCSEFRIESENNGRARIFLVRYDLADFGEKSVRSPFGQNLEDLVELMNAFRARALGAAR